MMITTFELNNTIGIGIGIGIGTANTHSLNKNLCLARAV